MKKSLKILVFTLILPIFLISCSGPDGKFKLPGGDARKTPADPKKRIEQNLKEGKGFRLSGEGGFFSNKGRGGVDMGDHPPITPCRAASPHELSGDMARVYDLVVRHFIATVSSDAVWRSTRVELYVEALGDKGKFKLSGKQVSSS